MRQHLILALLLLTAVATAVFGTPVTEAASPAVPTSAQIGPLLIEYPQSLSSIPILALIDRYPDDYSGSFFTDHPQALARLINGEIDVLATGFSVGLSRYTSAGDIVHLMTPVWGVSALMTGEPVDEIGELAGGLVYAPFEGSPIDIYLRETLADLSLAEPFRVQYAPFPQAAALLIQGKADAVVLVEPLASKLELEGSAYRLENLHDGWARISGGEPRSPQVSVFMSLAAPASSSAAAELLVARLTSVVAEVVADPAAYARRYAEDLGFPVPVIESALQNVLFATPDAGETRAIIGSYSSIMGLPAPGEDFYGFGGSEAD